MLRLSLLIPLLISACSGDETVTAYGAADRVWVLETVNDAPFQASATISFPEPGKVTGAGPCNSYTTNQTAPYPWFELGPIATTKRACADLPQEAVFLDMLANMTIVEVSGDFLVLSNEEKQQMTFKAQ